MPFYTHHGTRPVVLLDEYDAPMEAAWAGGYWDDASGFMRQLMISTFEANPALGRGLIAGVTLLPRDSVIGDLNNLEVVTASSGKYRDSFGFTRAEVDAALAEHGLSGMHDAMREFYDGFTFGGQDGIYNPWTITQFLKNGGVLDTWWANTSGNGLVSEVVRRGDEDLKADFEELMRGGTVEKVLDEQVALPELRDRPGAVWALLLAAGYVTSPGPVPKRPGTEPRTLRLTNHEVEVTFDRMVERWFGVAEADFCDFCDAILAGDADAATYYLAGVALGCMSSFGPVTRPGEGSVTESFYHGLVLGLLARLRGRYSVESNRESGFGRYDVALVPTDGAAGSDPAVVIEFKVFDRAYDGEETLADTVARAHAQIEERGYVAGLAGRGIAPGRVLTYGIAFRGKEVLVG